MNICIVCFGSLNEDLICLAPCYHVFHNHCLGDMWTGECPTCGSDILNVIGLKCKVSLKSQPSNEVRDNLLLERIEYLEEEAEINSLILDSERYISEVNSMMREELVWFGEYQDELETAMSLTNRMLDTVRARLLENKQQHEGNKFNPHPILSTTSLTLLTTLSRSLTSSLSFSWSSISQLITSFTNSL